MKTVEKKKAILLRKQGVSIQDIAKKLCVAKSSVSVWVREIQLTEKQLNTLSTNGFSKDIIEKRRLKRLSNEQDKRDSIMLLAGKAITKISKHELRLVGLCLYWGEGGKTNHGVARISNSDPAVIKVMMRFFREICLVDEKKFRGHIHTYSHLNAKVAEKYWSEVSGIPQTQLYKTYIKKSISSLGKKDKLPFGTFDIYVCNTKLFLEILGQLEKLKQILL
jgi:transposase-like protein